MKRGRDRDRDTNAVKMRQNTVGKSPCTQRERERALLKFSTKIFLSTANSVVETNLGEQK